MTAQCDAGALERVIAYRQHKSLLSGLVKENPVSHSLMFFPSKIGAQSDHRHNYIMIGERQYFV